MDSIRSQNRQVQFYVEAVDGTERRLVRRMLTLPPRLISFKVDKFELWTFSIIMGSLLSCPELRSLHLTGQYYSAAFLDIMLEEDDRLPPIQELVLRNYYWDHSRYTSINFWNWTKVTHLELQDVCVTRFLSTVTPEHLVQLRTFMLEPRCLDTKERKLASLMILNLLLKVHALEKLYLKCHLSVVFGGIIKHGSSLRSLELRDFRGRGSKEFCALSIDCVEAVGRSCPNLMELGMEVHFKANEGRANALHIVDTAITEMRNLRRLTLYTSTYQLNLPSAQNRDSFYHLDTAVRGWLHWFLGSKKGAEFEIIILKLRVEGGKATGDCIVPASVGMAWTYKNGKGIGLPAIDCRL